MESLSGQVALVTGCGRLKGLGRGIALALAEAGADLAISDISPGGRYNQHEHGEVEQAAGWLGLPSLVAEIESMGRKAFAVVGDVGLKTDADRMVADVIDHFARVDILVNNAGAPHGEERTWTWEVPEAAFDEIIRVNTKGVFLMSNPVVRHLLERQSPGRIVNIASNLGRQGAAKRSAYAASKFAVIGLTQSMALELAPHGITVNAVCPAGMDTARKEFSGHAPAIGETGGNISGGAPVGRMGVPKDIARTVAFLADPAAGYITGESIQVTGGKTFF